MITLSQVGRLVQRVRAARALGLHFTGTSGFALPPTAHLTGETRKLWFPDYEKDLALDIINIWLDDEYALKKIARPVRTIIDIGANVGLFSLWASHNFPSARIDAYEPNPVVVPFLMANLSGLHNTRVYGEGVADRDGRAQVILTRGGSRLAETRLDDEGEIEVTNIRRAIDRIGGTVDLVKLDCEGAEWPILRVAEAMTTVREIRMEYHLTEGRTVEDIGATAHDIGFRLTYLKENNNFGLAYLTNSR
jgi:FkbM family methyltransferase